MYLGYSGSTNIASGPIMTGLANRAAKKIDKSEDISPHVHYILEVKRGSASNISIDEDLRRLHQTLRDRAFLAWEQATCVC